MGFIERYVTYGTQRTDASVDFHHTGAMFLLSSIVGRAVQLPLSIGTIYPNLWFLWVGDSSISRKSTAMRYVTDILSKVSPGRLIPERFSPEGFLDDLHERSKGGDSRFTLVADEFGGLFEASHKKDYMSDVKDILMESYDNPPTLSRRTKHSSSVVNNPYLCLLAGISSQRFDDVVTPSDALDGFLARFVLVSPDVHQRPWKPVSMMDDAIISGHDAICEELSALNTIVMGLDHPVKARFTDEAMVEFNAFLQRMEGRVSNGTYGEVGPLISRLTMSTAKFAMLYAISEHFGRLSQNVFDVKAAHLRAATDLVESRYADYAVTRTRELDMSPKARKIYRVIKDYAVELPPANGGPAVYGIQFQEILRNALMSAKQFYAIVDSLEKAGFIVRFHQDYLGKNRTFWRVRRRYT